jgi:hypothetical protein
MREYAVTIVLENEARIQVKRKREKGVTTYYFALDTKMVIISVDELEDVCCAIHKVLMEEDMPCKGKKKGKKKK